MSAKTALIMATVAVMAFASSTDAFAAKKGKNKHARNNDVKHEMKHHASRRGLPLRIIMRDLRGRGFSRLRIRETYKSGYNIKACKRGRKVMLGVNRRGNIRWRERIGNCFQFYKYRDYGNSLSFRFRL